jgi:phosphate uptake regulator
VTAAFDDMAEMLRRSVKMFDLACRALLDNEPLDVDLDSLDDQVDAGERMVRRAILEHLAFNPKKDLVPSLILASMVQDAERIGDSARALAELVPLAKGPRSGPFADRLRRAAEETRPLFQRCIEAFRDDDKAVGRAVMDGHRALRTALQDLTRDVANSDLSADMAVVYALAARHTLRVSAHLYNIASSVVQPYDRIRHGDES